MNNSLEDLYAQSDPEQKLMILRMEMVTPISTIQGYVDLMEKYCVDEDIQDETLKDYLAVISKSADKLKKLFDDLS